MRKLLTFAGMMIWLTPHVICQEKTINPLEKGFLLNFSDDGNNSLRLGASMDLWARFIQLNPGTKNPAGELTDYDLDFVFRRITTSASLKLDRFTFFTMAGLGTQTYAMSVSPFTGLKPSVYLYDAFVSFDFIPQYLKIGYGLNLYKGLSRYSSASATRTLGADVPMLASPDVITTDQTARHFGFFATGNISQLSYRMNLGKPFVVNSVNKPAFGIDKAADISNNHLSFEGYFALQFLDKEGNAVPFMTGTYLGQKKIFNIGAGFYFHPQSTQSMNDAGDTIRHDKRHFAADLFLDYPVFHGGAITFYTALFKFDYGPNYSLNGGTANVLNSVPGSGISEPGYGTGDAVATQFAFLFPSVIGRGGKLQLYYEGDYRFYDAINDAALHHNFGINYFVSGHNLKFTLQQELRPYMNNGELESYKNLTLLKTQVFF